MAETDERVQQLIQEVGKQKKEIAKAEKPNWVTNCSFRFFDGGPSVNLHVESDLSVLVGICAYLQDRERSHKQAAETLGLATCPPYTCGGYSVADWIKDLKSRIDKIQIATKRKKLETLEARLNSIVSPELRAKLELEAISEELK